MMAAILLDRHLQSVANYLILRYHHQYDQCQNIHDHTNSRHILHHKWQLNHDNDNDFKHRCEILSFQVWQ